MYTKIVNLGRYSLEDITARAKRDVEKVFIYLTDGFLMPDERELKLRGCMIEISTDMRNEGGLCLEKGRMDPSDKTERSVKYDVEEMIRTEVMTLLDYEIYRVSKYLYQECKLLSINKDGRMYLNEHHKSIDNEENRDKRRAFAKELNEYAGLLLSGMIIKPNFKG